MLRTRFQLLVFCTVLSACTADGESSPTSTSREAAGGAGGAAAGATGVEEGQPASATPPGGVSGGGGTSQGSPAPGAQGGGLNAPPDIALACEVDCEAKQLCRPAYSVQTCLATCAEIAAQCPGYVTFLHCVAGGVTYSCGDERGFVPDRCQAEQKLSDGCLISHPAQPVGAGGSSTGSVGGAGGSF